MTKVVTARIASAIGRLPASEACWSTKDAVWPPTRTGNGAATARTSRTSSLAESPSGRPRPARSIR